MFYFKEVLWRNDERLTKKMYRVSQQETGMTFRRQLIGTLVNRIDFFGLSVGVSALSPLNISCISSGNLM